MTKSAIFDFVKGVEPRIAWNGLTNIKNMKVILEIWILSQVEV